MGPFRGHAGGRGFVMIEKSDSYRNLQQNKKLKYLFMALFSLLLFSMGYIFRYYFWPFLFALVFYIALSPLHIFVGRFVKRRSLSATLMIVLLFLGFLIPLFFLLLNLADQSYDVYSRTAFAYPGESSPRRPPKSCRAFRSRCSATSRTY